MRNLKITDLTAGYRPGGNEHIVFEKLSLELHAGELVCFMGPNGSGKSTLLRTIAGLQPALAGEISFGDLPPQRSIVEHVSVVLTDPVLVPHMTVTELVTLGRYPWLSWNLSPNQEDSTIVTRSISQVNIAHLAARNIDELSDGQRQMAMIARALAQDTPLLLLDEPTSHLDLDNRVEVMRLLRNLARTAGKSVLVATHELDLALQTADILWLASSGRGISTGIPEDLVLNGAIDDVFRFKGFDLKTGKINQEAHLGISVRVSGEGHEYRWTKNALERNGFSVDDAAAITLTVQHKGNVQWQLQGNTFQSLADVLRALKSH